MIYGVPLPVFWTVGGIAVVLGLLMIVRTDKTVRTMRRWLLRQLRWVRTPGYRRHVKLNGWALFVLGTLMLVLMTWVQAVAERGCSRLRSEARQGANDAPNCAWPRP